MSREPGLAGTIESVVPRVTRTVATWVPTPCDLASLLAANWRVTFSKFSK